jgi:hypothetical protein
MEHLFSGRRFGFPRVLLPLGGDMGHLREYSVRMEWGSWWVEIVKRSKNL